ncbi:hypothetical protein [Saccharopolyspora spinosa]|uniref:Uncharacterized protein n=1 Tax=Saccharopolyspora spinosa TaxID=60894 RepID=A0A2N3Y282_SACSN|nr:hypothetical protein [Saccharopolyspora spinosa]PKW17005.1 hypothetical protein A8926_4921 [Saccharopolyspora spinosa]
MVEELVHQEIGQLLVDHPLPRLATAAPRQVDRVDAVRVGQRREDAVPGELDGVEHPAVQEQDRFVLLSPRGVRPHRSAGEV